MPTKCWQHNIKAQANKLALTTYADGAARNTRAFSSATQKSRPIQATWFIFFSREIQSKNSPSGLSIFAVLQMVQQGTMFPAT